MAVIPLDIQQIMYLYTINAISVNYFSVIFLLKGVFLALWTQLLVLGLESLWQGLAFEDRISMRPGLALTPACTLADIDQAAPDAYFNIEAVRKKA
jgi:hypothetical protein